MKRNALKRTTVFLLSALLALLMMASASAEVTLEAFPQKPENNEIFMELFEQFMQENPDIVIEVTNVADTQTVLTTRVATNDVPDLVNLLPTQLSTQVMQREGVFAPLTEYEQLFEKISDKAVEMCTIDGEIYCVPVTFSGFGLYYNRDIFAEQGLSVPTTSEELFDVCEKLQAQGIQPFTLADKDVSNLQQVFERILAGSVDHDIKTTCEEVAAGNQSFAEDERMIAFAEFMLKLREYGPEDSLGVDIDQARSDFAQGEVAMYIDGSWAVSVVEAYNPELNFEVAPFPTITEEETWVVGSPDTAWAISATTEHFDECMRFMEFFLREDIGARYSHADMNPTVMDGVDYDVEPMEKINALVSEGKFVLNPSSFWDSSLRAEIRSNLQMMLIDQDVNAFLTTLDSLIRDNYNSKE